MLRQYVLAVTFICTFIETQHNNLNLQAHPGHCFRFLLRIKKVDFGGGKRLYHAGNPFFPLLIPNYGYFPEAVYMFYIKLYILPGCQPVTPSISQ